jgi:hypothetical protein
LRFADADPPAARRRATSATSGWRRALAPVERWSPGAALILHRGRKVMLDHLLVSPALLPWCRRVVIDNEGLGDEAVPAAELGPESFHAPIVAEFVLPENDD